MARAITPRHQRHRQQREDNPHQPSQPHQRDKRQRDAKRHARVPSYEGYQSRDAGQRDDSARWSHDALKAHPGQPGRRCHERQQER